MSEGCHKATSELKSRQLPVLNVSNASASNVKPEAVPAVPEAAEPVDLASMQQSLSRKQGKEFWRSLEELAGTKEFKRFLHNEFPFGIEPSNDPKDRRGFLKLMGASLALAGLTACTKQPTELIVPYVHPPDGVIPGIAQFYATAMSLGGFADGLLVVSREGRPVKVEGNPDHPISKGGTELFAQASILGLYDPDRSQFAMLRGETHPYGEFLTAVKNVLDDKKSAGGAGVRILTQTVNSPTLASQLTTFLAQYPAAKWHRYEPLNRDQQRAGAQMAFGEIVDPQYRFNNADVVLSIGSDFLGCMAGNVNYARDFINRRRVTSPESDMNRLYVVETPLTNTGAKADHRLPLRPSQIEGFARAVAAALGVSVPAGGASPSTENAAWIKVVANDLQAHKGRSIVIVGEQQPPVVHAIAHAINQTLGNSGATVIYTQPIEYTDQPNYATINQTESLRQLVNDMNANQVELLLIIGGNPVFDAPADIPFAAALEKVKLRAHLSLYNDETSYHCHWHIPQLHYLETWSDARAADGTISIVQPLIAPLYNGKTPHDILAGLNGQPDKTNYEIVRAYWQGLNKTGNFEDAWRKALNDGLIANTAQPAKTVTVKGDWGNQSNSSASGGAGQFEIVFRQDPTIYDGRFANNGWLQELPKPLTKLTWDNAALMSPFTAIKLGIATKPELSGKANGMLVTLNFKGKALTLPVWVMAGHADDSVTIYLGYGRERAGRVGNGTGFNGYKLRTSDAMWSGSGLQVSVAGGSYPLMSTQEHFTLDGRTMIRPATLEEYRKHPAFAREDQEIPDKDFSLYPDYQYKDNKWGMSIDQNSCVGCNACVVACVAENNIPVVGKEQVGRGREMHWLRIDTYYLGKTTDDPEVKDNAITIANPEVYFQPMLCQHCEHAPCEVVCPVNATMHDSEGLSVQVYNRCVGTRYCSNNCPYKVRRFNFLLFQDWDTPSLKLMRNPEVSVRSRGVMEKCSFCVQRIITGRIAAEKEDRPIRDGEVVTACQSACPTGAIVFGNMNDPNAKVTKLKAQEKDYGVLAELNTTPRVTYLAPLTNPNGEIRNGGNRT